MNRQEKIDKIYSVIADKTLSFGCKFKLKSGAITIATGEPSGPFITCLFFQQTRLENIEKIIGHPVMIGDVLDWIENNMNNGFKKCCECGSDMIYDETYYCSNEECENEREPEDLVFLNKWDLVIENIGRDSRFINNDIFLWKKLKAPIEDQSDECVDFIYDLIFK